MVVPPTPSKPALRAAMRLQRREWVAALGDRRAQAEAMLATHLGRRLPPGPLAGYVATGAEIDPALLAPHAWPWFAAPDAPMRFRAGPPTAPGPFGIAQPHPYAPLIDPAVVLVPLLAVDARGVRLGQGRGHYDRWLARLPYRRAVFAIGLAWECQLVDRVPADPWDITLDAWATPIGYHLPAPPE